MANLKIEGLKGSEVLKIKAAVVETMENSAGITATEDPDIKELSDGSCQMSFKKKESSLSEMNKLHEKLGKNFEVNVIWMKDMLSIILSAPKEDFARLIGKNLEKHEPSAPQPGLNFGGQQGDEQK